ncbi:hypothetical protein GX50_06303 [[Emmonsia] crescens]|uniref:Uncharacterized protein n=1 Tax=[Emmonsia] crescens TaxID=73230 RepID=A0A2B7ZAF1_9EURO|nr:hypothetical protein GX50_06303 [Emmonsia crescens]
MRSSSSPSSHSSLFPAALSIYQLARLNCRERLLVDPLQWTSRHVELLQCFFEKPSLAPSLASSTTQPDLINGRPVGCYVQALCSERHLKDLRISLIFEAPGGPFTTLDRTHFYFNLRHVCALPCAVFFLESGFDANAPTRAHPVAAHIDRYDIDDLRGKNVPRQSRRYSEPTSALFRLKHKKVTPLEPLHDPYIVALLIGLAYHQRYALQGNHKEEPANACSTFLCKVLFTDTDDKQYIHLFVADIPYSFLLKLDFPACPPSPLSPPSFSIRHTMIPYKPYNTFRERILPLLLATL